MTRALERAHSISYQPFCRRTKIRRWRCRCAASVEVTWCHYPLQHLLECDVADVEGAERPDPARVEVSSDTPWTLPEDPMILRPFCTSHAAAGSPRQVDASANKLAPVGAPLSRQNGAKVTPNRAFDVERPRDDSCMACARPKRQRGLRRWARSIPRTAGAPAIQRPRRLQCIEIAACPRSKQEQTRAPEESCQNAIF